MNDCKGDSQVCHVRDAVIIEFVHPFPAGSAGIVGAVLRLWHGVGGSGSVDVGTEGDKGRGAA